MKTAEEISDLLAHRDGERLDPERARAIDADPASRSELAVLRLLWRDGHARGQLRRDCYRELGGLGGALANSASLMWFLFFTQ